LKYEFGLGGYFRVNMGVDNGNEDKNYARKKYTIYLSGRKEAGRVRPDRHTDDIKGETEERKNLPPQVLQLVGEEKGREWITEGKDGGRRELTKKKNLNIVFPTRANKIGERDSQLKRDK